jgi:hypothetical protein
VYELLCDWIHGCDWDTHGVGNQNNCAGDQPNDTQHKPDDGHSAESLKVELIHFVDLPRADIATIMARDGMALCVDGVDVTAIWVCHAVEPLDMVWTHRSTACSAGLRAAQIAAGELTELT